jgi:hypothetical protein
MNCPSSVLNIASAVRRKIDAGLDPSPARSKVSPTPTRYY